MRFCNHSNTLEVPRNRGSERTSGATGTPALSCRAFDLL